MINSTLFERLGGKNAVNTVVNHFFSNIDMYCFQFHRFTEAQS
jgi:hypothetical protein